MNRHPKAAIARWLAPIIDCARQEKGLGIVDSLVAVAILGLAASSFVTALSTGSIAVHEEEVELIAQRLARNQLEYIKSYPYDPGASTYPTVDAPDGYSISVGVSSIPDTDDDIQKITVTISRDGQDILSVENYKVNR